MRSVGRVEGKLEALRKLIFDLNNGAQLVVGVPLLRQGDA